MFSNVSSISNQIKLWARAPTRKHDRKINSIGDTAIVKIAETFSSPSREDDGQINAIDQAVATGIRLARSRLITTLVRNSVVVAILAYSQRDISKICEAVVIAIEYFAVESLDKEINVDRVDDTVLIDVRNGAVIIGIRLALSDAGLQSEEI